MTTFPLSVLVDPLKIEELFQKIENRKKLEQMLMDPRVIEMSRQSPKSRQALAAVVRRLQEERARKRRIKNAEQKEELPPAAKWFNCINFLKNFSTPPRPNSRHIRRSSEAMLRHRNKLTRSTPNLESTALPNVVTEELPTYYMNPQVMANDSIVDMAVCIPNMAKGSLPLNLMEFCTSEKGKKMISSLINSTDLKQVFGFKSFFPTQCHRLFLCIDCLNCSDLQCIQYYVPRKSCCQRFIIMRSRASRYSSTFPQLTFDGHGSKSVVSSATQTAYSGSCSQCSSHCLSSDSFSSYIDGIRDENSKPNPYQFPLCKRSNTIKGSKSQSAMYTTDYSECDCDDFSSDEICGGKYLSRILTNTAVPDINYLASPDVLVTYSGNGHSSDSGSLSSSCKACKGNISSESFQREPREIWTQKRLKTSCESCLNTFRTEYIRKSRNSKEMSKLSNRSGSFGSLCSDESSPGITNDIRGISEELYVEAKSILDIVGEQDKGDGFDKRELIMKDVSVYEQRTIQEEKYVEIKNNKCLNSDGNNVPFIHFEGGIASNEKQIESVFESPAQSLAPTNEKTLPYSSAEKERNTNIKEYPKTQLDGGPALPRCDSTDLQSALQDRNSFLEQDIFSSSSSGNDSTNTESIVARMRKQRKRVRNKCGSTSCVSDSSSTSSAPQLRTFPRRLKPKVVPFQNPTVPQQNLLQKISKQKSKKKNCAIM